MPAISNTLFAREAVNTIAKRQNWAAQEPGVIVVFCIVFIVLVALIALLIQRQIAKRKASSKI